MDNASSKKIGIIGLGYVGLPLAIEFGKKYPTIGFDLNEIRIEELKSGIDRNQETRKDEINSANKLFFSSNINDLKGLNVYIITVPTPIDRFKKPDLMPLLKASAMVGTILKKNDIVIYESTVYPGCTEEDCVPVLEKKSGLIYNVDFYCGYSPERINPGDKMNTLTKIKKVTSGSTPSVADIVDELYNSIITAGTYKANSLKVAEASKAIENAQRDINISFMNELALIFDKMDIDTNDVIEAAATKWNFLKYKPGLVGGHCIGVDPYYLAHKAESLGYNPQVILSGRRVNDTMASFIVTKVIKLMIRRSVVIKHARALLLGVTFKENCADFRNSKVVDIYNELSEFGLEIDLYDPHVNEKEIQSEFNIQLVSEIVGVYDLIILAVAHNEFLELDFQKLKKNADSVIFDCKAFLDRKIVDARL